MTQNKQLAIMLTILIFGSAYFNFQIQQNKADIESIINKKTIFRYMSIDRIFELRHAKPKQCIDATNKEVRDYYDGYSVPVTPIAKLILSGEFRCKQ